MTRLGEFYKFLATNCSQNNLMTFRVISNNVTIMLKVCGYILAILGKIGNFLFHHLVPLIISSILGIGFDQEQWPSRNRNHEICELKFFGQSGPNFIYFQFSASQSQWQIQKTNRNNINETNQLKLWKSVDVMQLGEVWTHVPWHCTVFWSVWPEKNLQTSIKVAQTWFH